MSRLKLYLFGPPRLEDSGVNLDVRPRKALALLIYLAVTHQPHSRDALATLFWPESDQTAARASLRRTLYLLQQVLPVELLDTTGDTIRLAAHGDLWLDTSAYQELLDKASSTQTAPATSSITSSATLSVPARDALIAAAALYGDDFLAGFTLDDAPAFDEWQFFQQESLRQSLAHLLLQLKQSYSAAGDFSRAIDYARRWLALDPLHEPAHRDLMLLYAWAGQHTAALRQFQECQRVLRDELGVEPEEETVALYQTIRAKQTPPPPVAAPPSTLSVSTPPGALPSPFTAELSPAAPISATIGTTFSTTSGTSVQPSLPLHTTSFIGREREVAHIYKLVTQEANCRLLTLVGPSGIGKTRLALEVARRILDEDSTTPFGDGIIFVPLTAVSEPSSMAAAIAAAAGLQFGRGPSSQQQLLNYLHDKHALLVLDHIEHLLAGAPLLADILRAAPNIKILATSLEGIHLQEAWFLPVGTLSFPAKHFAGEMSLHEYDAIRLFEQRARRVRVGFTLDEEAAHVIRICQLVEGVPLALELAASWLKVLSAARIADEIERSMDILTTGYEDVPERHRSMRAVLEQSWELLLQPERAVFKRLSVFHGGFTAEAAYAVVGAELMMLATLVDKSLLQLHNNGRYQCHELLRQFAAEQLALWTDEFDEVNGHHCAYYMDFLRRHGQGIKGRGQKRALEEISADIGNVMVAWRTAVAQRAVPALAAAAPCIWLFSHYRGMLDEGEAAFAHALDALAGAVSRDDGATDASGDLPSNLSKSLTSDPAVAELVGFLRAGQGWMQGRRGDLERGRALMEEGLASLRQISTRSTETEAFVVSYLALTAQYQERQLEARQIVKQSLDAYTAIGDLWGMATGLEIAGTAALGYGQLEEAKQLLGQCLALAQVAGEQRSRLLAMTYLALIAVTTGNYAEAKTLLDEALTMSTELGDRIATAVILTQLGKYALEQGEHATALQHLQHSLVNLRAAGVDYPAEVLDCMCATYRARADLEGAEQVGREALQMAQARGIQRRIFTSLSMLGCVAQARHEYARAIDLQTQALTLCRPTQHEPDTASILRYLGHATLAQGVTQGVAQPVAEGQVNEHLVSARHHYHAALQLALKHRLAPIALDCLAGVAELLLHIHDQEQAGTLLQLVAMHPASSHEARQRAAGALVARRADLQLALRSGGDTSSEWQTVTQHVIDLLARPDWGQPRQLTRNVPTHLTPFVGRQQEILDICQNLENPNCRLLTLVGLGGIGKTRLAVEVAHHLAASEQGARIFGDGIVFVPLASVVGGVVEGDELAGAIAEAMEIAGYGTQPLRHHPLHHRSQRLLQALANQRLLLILDNFEQVATGAELLSEILHSTRAVKILVTSRVALDVPAAWFYPVGGMSFPTAHSTMSMESFEAVQLFVQCARRVRANFSLATAQASSMAAVARICQMVEGMPLALELAASWLKVLIIENVAEEISRGMDILATNAAGARATVVSTRHQSMRVVMQQTWTLLSQDEQQAFMRLAVFRGGFRREAADKVAGANLALLAQLMEKSLLRVTESGRYSIHELLRQFALEKLQESLHAEEDALRQYSAYYLQFIADRVQPIVGWRGQTISSELEEEIDNITSAWQWRLHQNDLEAIERSQPTYFHFLWLRGYGQLGRDVFAQALQHLTNSATARAHPRYEVVYQPLAGALGTYYYFMGDFESATRTLELSLAAARRMNNKVAIGSTLNMLGVVMAWQGKCVDAHTYLAEAKKHFDEAEYKNGLADVLHELARIAVFEGDYAKGRELAAQSMAYSEEIQRPEWVAYAQMEWGVSNFCLGLYAEAQRDLESALAIFQAYGHAVGIAFALGELAWLTWATGGTQSAEADTRARESLAIARRVGHRLQVSYRLAQLAQFANDRRDYAEAERFAEEGLALATALNTPHFISENLCMLAEAAYQQREFAKARHYLAQACRAAAGAELTGRLLLTVYHAALALALNAARSADQQAQALVWLELCLQHKESWHVLKERAASQLAFVRAQAPDAARLAEQMAAGASDLDQTLAQATAMIVAWASEEVLSRV